MLILLGESDNRPRDEAQQPVSAGDDSNRPKEEKPKVQADLSEFTVQKAGRKDAWDADSRTGVKGPGLNLQRHRPIVQGQDSAGAGQPEEH